MFGLVVCFHCYPYITDKIDSIFSNVRFRGAEVSDKVLSYWSNIKDNFSQDIGEKLFELRCENIKLKLKADQVNSVIDENNQLKKLLKMKESANSEIVFAKVVDIFNNDFVRSALINVGRNHNVELDNFAYNEDGLIGRVIEVDENWSKVLFIVDANSNIPARIAGMNAMLSGDNSDLLKVNLLKEEIKEGDKVESSSYGKVFQDDILIGKVMKKDDEFFVVPSVNFNNLKYVCIGKCQD